MTTTTAPTASAVRSAVNAAGVRTAGKVMVLQHSTSVLLSERPGGTYQTVRAACAAEAAGYTVTAEERDYDGRTVYRVR